MKRCLMQRASAIVFPSLSEGFGLPVLEGFASRTPVITSNSTSLFEVAGEAAVLVDPYNVHAISEAMQTLVLDEGISKIYRERGVTRARSFSWELCATKTVKIYEKILSN